MTNIQYHFSIMQLAYILPLYCISIPCTVMKLSLGPACSTEHPIIQLVPTRSRCNCMFDHTNVLYVMSLFAWYYNGSRGMSALVTLTLMKYAHQMVTIICLSSASTCEPFQAVIQDRRVWGSLICYLTYFLSPNLIFVQQFTSYCSVFC